MIYRKKSTGIIALKNFLELLKILTSLWKSFFFEKNNSAHEDKKSPENTILHDGNRTGFPVFGDLKKEKFSEGWSLLEKRVRLASRSQKELAQNLARLARENYMHNPYNAVRVMWESNELLPNESKQKWLAFRLHELDLVKESYMMLTAVPKSRYEKISEINRYRMIETDYNYQRYLSEISLGKDNHDSVRS